MIKNKYFSDLDIKIYSLVSKKEKGEVSEKVFNIALKIMMKKYLFDSVLKNYK